LTLKATIVAKNRGGNCVDQVRDGGFDLEDGNSCGFAKHAVKANPRVASVADNGGSTKTMALGRRSPAINSIRAKSAVCRGTIDQRGCRGHRAAAATSEHSRSSPQGHGYAFTTGTEVEPARVDGNRAPERDQSRAPDGQGRLPRRSHGSGTRELDADSPDTASLKVRLNAGSID
jgi:hypothetical protein